jgi:hypothetical protein
MEWLEYAAQSADESSDARRTVARLKGARSKIRGKPYPAKRSVKSRGGGYTRAVAWLT